MITAGIEILVVPFVFMRLNPVMIKRPLINQDLDVRITHRPAVIVFGLDRCFDLVAKPERFLMPVHLRRLHSNLIFRQFIFLKAE